MSKHEVSLNGSETQFHPVLLVSAPFDSISRPHIALSQLKAVLVKHGVPSQIEYLNLDFAAKISSSNYRLISEQYPTAMLLGDALFSESAFDRRVEWGDFLEQSSIRWGEEVGHRHRTALLNSLPGLSDFASAWVHEISEQAIWSKTKFVGFSATFNLIPSLAIARHIKLKWPDTTIVFGGAQCDGTLGEAIMRNFQYVDFVCRGEGEHFVVSIVDQLDSDAPGFDQVPGTCWRTPDGVVCSTESRGLKTDLASLPNPQYDDWTALRDSCSFSGDHITYPLETSRGCWWGEKAHCTFCGLNGLGMAFREKPSEQVLNQIFELRDTGARHLFAVDNILPMSYFTSVLPALASESESPDLFYEVKSNLTFEQCQLLAKARVTGIQPGIESLSTDILKLMRKGTTAFLNVRLLRYAREAGLHLAWNMLYGFPFEDPSEYERQASLIPLIKHLEPPLSPGNAVRLDRFSPLFFDRQELGVDSIEPSPAYRFLYNLPAAELEDLAVFFDFDGAFRGDPVEYSGSLRRQIHDWRADLGEAVLVAVDDGDKIEILDSRGKETKQHTLSDEIALIYRACVHGVGRSKLNAVSGCSIKATELAIAKLIDEQLVICLDSRYLALPVNRPASQFSDIPRPLWLATAAIVCRHSMRRCMEHQNRHLLKQELITWPPSVSPEKTTLAPNPAKEL